MPYHQPHIGLIHRAPLVLISLPLSQKIELDRPFADRLLNRKRQERGPRAVRRQSIVESSQVRISAPPRQKNANHSSQPAAIPQPVKTQPASPAKLDRHLSKERL